MFLFLRDFRGDQPFSLFVLDSVSDINILFIELIDGRSLPFFFLFLLNASKSISLSELSAGTFIFGFEDKVGTTAMQQAV